MRQLLHFRSLVVLGAVLGAGFACGADNLVRGLPGSQYWVSSVFNGDNAYGPADTVNGAQNDAQNGGNDDRWIGAAGASPWWIAYDLGVAQKVRHVRIYQETARGEAETFDLHTFDVRGANTVSGNPATDPPNSGSWTTIASYSGGTRHGQPFIDFVFNDAPITYRYLALWITVAEYAGGGGANGVPRVVEFEVYSDNPTADDFNNNSLSGVQWNRLLNGSATKTLTETNQRIELVMTSHTSGYSQVGLVSDRTYPLGGDRPVYVQMFLDDPFGEYWAGIVDDAFPGTDPAAADPFGYEALLFRYETGTNIAIYSQEPGARITLPVSPAMPTPHPSGNLVAFLADGVNAAYGPSTTHPCVEVFVDNTSYDYWWYDRNPTSGAYDTDKDLEQNSRFVAYISSNAATGNAKLDDAVICNPILVEADDGTAGGFTYSGSSMNLYTSDSRAIGLKDGNYRGQDLGVAKNGVCRFAPALPVEGNYKIFVSVAPGTIGVNQAATDVDITIKHNGNTSTYSNWNQYATFASADRWFYIGEYEFGKCGVGDTGNYVEWAVDAASGGNYFKGDATMFVPMVATAQTCTTPVGTNALSNASFESISPAMYGIVETFSLSGWQQVFQGCNSQQDWAPFSDSDGNYFLGYAWDGVAIGESNAKHVRQLVDAKPGPFEAQVRWLGAATQGSSSPAGVHANCRGRWRVRAWSACGGSGSPAGETISEELIGTGEWGYYCLSGTLYDANGGSPYYAAGDTVTASMDLFGWGLNPSGFDHSNYDEVILICAQPPDTTVTTPTESAEYMEGNNIAMSGSVTQRTDSVRISPYGTELRLRRDGSQYWNGSGWQGSEVWFTTGVSQPGASGGSWSFTLTSAPTGAYQLSARSYDAFNYTECLFQIVNFTVNQGVEDWNAY